MQETWIWLPWLGRSLGEENGNSLQYSCMENLMDRGAWWATVHGITKGSDKTEWASTHKAIILRLPRAWVWETLCAVMLINTFNQLSSLQGQKVSGPLPPAWHPPTLPLFITPGAAKLSECCPETEAEFSLMLHLARISKEPVHFKRRSLRLAGSLRRSATAHKHLLYALHFADFVSFHSPNSP